MEFATDHLIARLLLTLNTLGYGLAPVFADFNKTHATNPLWTPHCALPRGVAGVELLRRRVDRVVADLERRTGRQALAAVALAVAMYAGFLRDRVLDAALRRSRRRHQWHSGRSQRLRIGGKPLALDANVTVFSVQVAILDRGRVADPITQEEAMITALVQFALPQPISLAEATKRFESSAPKYQNLAGLVRKYYVRAEDGRSAGGIYLWETRRGRSRLQREWRERVRNSTARSRRSSGSTRRSWSTILRAPSARRPDHAAATFCARVCAHAHSGRRSNGATAPRLKFAKIGARENYLGDRWSYMEAGRRTRRVWCCCTASARTRCTGASSLRGCSDAFHVVAWNAPAMSFPMAVQDRDPSCKDYADALADFLAP